VFGPFFFAEKSVTGQVYLKMLQNWLMPQLAEEEEFIFQQDGAPPHWHMGVREYLNGNLPGRWIGRASAADNIFCTWPPRSPDMTVCDFFLWGFVKDNVYSPPHFRRRFRNCEDASTMPSRMSQKTCLRGFGENGSTAWTPAASHVVRTSNAFKVITKLQTFLFQMPVVSCIFVYYY
jgi:hypothetical protein